MAHHKAGKGTLWGVCSDNAYLAELQLAAEGVLMYTAMDSGLTLISIQRGCLGRLQQPHLLILLSSLVLALLWASPGWHTTVQGTVAATCTRGWPYSRSW
jgi:hypothetical protein